jgi:hypothetical protein
MLSFRAANGRAVALSSAVDSSTALSITDGIAATLAFRDESEMLLVATGVIGSGVAISATTPSERIAEGTSVGVGRSGSTKMGGVAAASGATSVAIEPIDLY